MRSPKQWLEDVISDGVWAYLNSRDTDDKVSPIEMGVCLAMENFLEENSYDVLHTIELN
jgi:hypothetical protein